MPISLRSYTPRHATPRHVVCPPAGCNVGRTFLSCRTVSANDVASHPRLDIKLLEEALGRLQHYVLLPPRGRLIFMRTCISMVPLYPLSCMLPPGICGLEIRADLIVQTISPADRLCHCNRTRQYLHTYELCGRFYRPRNAMLERVPPFLRLGT